MLPAGRLALCAVLLLLAHCRAGESKDYFVITVVDEKTGRGVPLVELATVNDVKFYTDSNGIIALNEPGLANQKVYFHVKSHGYECAADGFGYRGKALDVKPGGSATLKIKRLNIAERLYRLTGEGIYRDSILAGRAAPLKQPLLNGQVFGQDSVQMAPYRGKLYWFWGDTNRPSYPLGHFGTSGATSLPPGAGGLDPDKGVDFEYFMDKHGFSRPMIALSGDGPKWIDALLVIKDDSGRERLLCKCSRMKNLGECLERALMVFNDEKDVFEPLAKLDLKTPLCPQGQAFRHRDGGQEYIYFASPFPVVRVKAEWKAIQDPAAYEGFTCLERKIGDRQDVLSVPHFPPKLNRGADGKLAWQWQPGTAPLTFAQQKELLATKRIKPEEALYRFTDAETGKPVQAHAGSVNYNAFRKRWIMIFHQTWGAPSNLGEVYHAEAPAPEGPWEKARKIVTHDRYSFYNVKHHPEFDQDGGRIVYFEGTYTAQFSGNPNPTPRYDYNQIMYRLDLSDERLR